MIDSYIRLIQLHRPPIDSYLVRRQVQERPQDRSPYGATCGQCGRSSLLVPEMWPIEFLCEKEGVVFSLYVYCCSEKHAAAYILSWERGSGEVGVG